MKKINLKKAPIILVVISLVIIIISLICGISLCSFIAFGLDSLTGMNVDGSDLSPVVRIFGYMSLPIISVFIMGVCIIVALIVDGIIWSIYGISKLLKKLIIEKRWKTLIVLGIIIVTIILAPNVDQIVNTPILDSNTISYISYDYKPKK